MKKYNISSFVLRMLMPLLLLGACDYLDVMPTEQITEDDTVKDVQAALGFLGSSYIGVRTTIPVHYNTWEGSTDEFVNPPLWNEASQRLSYNQLSGNSTSNGIWEACYGYIGHIHLFMRQLDRTTPLGATEEDKDDWRAEARFVKAFYHFRLLEHFGPIPIMDAYPDQNISASEMLGRSHFDYVVDYIVNTLDEVEDQLPAKRIDSEWGRATKAASLAIKGRTLLYAASPLWNGGFPFPEWKNTNFETPGYGYELVSAKYNESKWKRALDANLKALEYAEREGERSLLTTEQTDRLVVMQDVPLPFVPGIDPDTEEGEKFLRDVLLLRYRLRTFETDGNRETIWGVIEQNTTNMYACWPLRVFYRNNAWEGGFCAMAPCLYSVENFYTSNGYLPKDDPDFPSENRWLQSANIQDRPEIINLNVLREPRFYATFSFDGDDYSSKMDAGNPKRIDMRSSEAQGWSPSAYNRDYSVTGYLTKKYTQPNIQYNTQGDNRRDYPIPLFRLAELYLNIAECYAALEDIPNALKYLNPIRKRAGIKELSTSDLGGRSIMDWVRNERFIELWGEGHRYYDVRRWMIAPERLAPNSREGLNTTEKTNPSIEEFNQRVIVDQPFQWENRMYLSPIHISEIYSNPQLVQAPGY